MANIERATSSTLSMQVASEIRALMARRGMTAVQLGRLVGYSHPWVSERLRGERSITVTDLERIAGALGVQVLDLFPPTAERSPREVLATIGLDMPHRREIRRLRRVTEQYERHPVDRRPAGGPGGSATTPRRTSRLVETAQVAA